ncbi:hypothetical protein T11_12338 [Trichinella zimbabwensis]|uniref:Uncharacterized protein n=1 Tax=Trichinella zimbabwensis TaxID=268475 RepID=A0A0V1H5W7_9BILA|nr:hypothetical protein T11_12338 [Trichinella zimbabwensis]
MALERFYYIMLLVLFHTFYQSLAITVETPDRLCSDNKPTVIDSIEDISLRTLTAEFLKKSITNIAQMRAQFMEQDPDDERSSKARQDV